MGLCYLIRKLNSRFGAIAGWAVLSQEKPFIDESFYETKFDTSQRPRRVRDKVVIAGGGESLLGTGVCYRYRILLLITDSQKK
jgi:hypothetical protein